MRELSYGSVGVPSMFEDLAQSLVLETESSADSCRPAQGELRGSQQELGLLTPYSERSIQGIGSDGAHPSC